MASPLPLSYTEVTLRGRLFCFPCGRGSRSEEEVDLRPRGVLNERVTLARRPGVLSLRLSSYVKSPGPEEIRPANWWLQQLYCRGL